MRSLAVIVITTLALASCARPATPTRSSVVVGAYPLAEVVRALVWPSDPVFDLTPSGAEPHDLELTPRQVDRVLDADLVVFVGGGFQPAVAAAARRAKRTVDVLAGAGGTDPHVWLDPVAMSRMTDQVEAALRRVHPDRAPILTRRAERFRSALASLDQRWRQGLANCDRRLLVTAHAAFGRLAARYGLRQEAIAGISPDTEPNPKRLDDLRRIVADNGVTTVFTEHLVSPAVANTLARETGAATARLDPIESSQGRGDPGYLARMDANLVALRGALGCR